MIDKNAEVDFTNKNLLKKWTESEMLGKILYFFNPKVVKLITRDFEAERINYNKLQTQKTTVTPSNMIVTWLDLD
jgi:hypothetical protein